MENEVIPKNVIFSWLWEIQLYKLKEEPITVLQNALTFHIDENS